VELIRERGAIEHENAHGLERLLEEVEASS